METKIFKVTKDSLDILCKASELLSSGELVAFPTETVYGLGANAYDGEACKSIFLAKGRPSDNPLIVHISKPEDAENIAYTTPLYYELAKRFMPGPLTVILPKKEVIPNEVTAGLDTVAIRCPKNEVANKLIEISKIPIAPRIEVLSLYPKPMR
jgi:L-threonylcarbamoyladenylate synthase